MSVSLVQLKQELRRRLREKLQAMTAAQREAGSDQARRRLQLEQVWKDVSASGIIQGPLRKEASASFESVYELGEPEAKQGTPA